MPLSLSYDETYIKTIYGVLKICCLVSSALGILCIVCSSVAVQNTRGLLYLIIASVSFCCTLVILLMHAFQVWERQFYNSKALKYGAYVHGTLACGFVLASSAALSLDVISYSMATFFGCLAFVFYAYDSYLTYRLSRQSSVATQT